MKYKLASFDTGDTWNVTASSEKLAISKLVKKYPRLNGDLHCISCTHLTSELKTKKMAKKYKTKSKSSRKMLSGYIGQSPWVLTFTTKKGDKFKKKFKSETTLDRAIAGWRSAGGQVKWTPTNITSVLRSRGKRKSK